MTPNVTKCCVVNFSRKVSPLYPSYTLSGSLMTVNTVIKDLGTYVDVKLTLIYLIMSIF